MVKFIDTVKIKKSGCTKCFSIFYILPCTINIEIADYLISFGKPLYRLNATSLLRIDTKDNFHIEGKIGSKKIKLVMPKEYLNKDWDSLERKNEFEKCLAKWISDRLKIEIER